jgi:glycerol-3-phosphate dehydrogenase
VIALEKEDDKICGARVQDKITGDEFSIRAHGVINATGPFVDHIRHMDDPQASTILEASSGIHIILPKRFVPPNTGMLIPKTEDGRVLFILPWQNHALIGTTDAPAEIVDHPHAKENEINYILHHINKYFDAGVTRNDVMSVWCGLRPLVHFKDTANTAQLVREHAILTSKSGLLTIAGGKWTSYRRMAEETVDKAVHFFELRPERKCMTHDFPVVGAENFNPDALVILAENYDLEPDVAEHLHHTYGDQASKVAELTKLGLEERLHAHHPYIEAEVVYAARNEFAKRASDILVRRTSLGLLDLAAAKEALPRVIELMADTLKWDEARCTQEHDLCMERLSVSL